MACGVKSLISKKMEFHHLGCSVSGLHRTQESVTVMLGGPGVVVD